MLADMMTAITDTGYKPTVLSTAPVEFEGDAAVATDNRPLTPAVNDQLLTGHEDEAVVVVMADLILTMPDSLERLFASDGDVVITPRRGGETNTLFVRHSRFRVG